MIVNLKFDDYYEQQFIYDLCHISTLVPGTYKMINTSAKPEVMDGKEPVRREVEIEVDIDDEFDKNTVAEIMKMWSKHYQTSRSENQANNYKSEIDSIRKELLD
jgi:hypothetical protein|tara:strand:- start:210 stop:521 length:312 start_codon:yes stop_codon:yes gene_type:complete